MDLIISILIGILTGLLSGYIVTKFYRWRDGERDRAMYLGELNQYFLKLSEVIFDGGLEIEEKDTDRLLDFYVKHEIPTRYKWVKFSKKDLQKVEEIEVYIKNMCTAVMMWKLNKMKQGKDKEEQNSLEVFGEDIVLKARLNFTKINDTLLSLMRIYVHKSA